jgi:predicted RecB family nuclease
MPDSKAISDPIFAAFLECETKSYLLQQGVAGLTSETEALKQSLDVNFTLRALDRLRAGVPERDVLVGTPAPETLRTGTYSLIVGPEIPFSMGTAHPDALERLPAAGARARVMYRPIRCTRNQKVTAAEKLTLAFDTLAVAEAVGQTPSTGKFVHGSKYIEQSVPMTKLLVAARKVLNTCAVTLSSAAPPVLELNKHCPTCEFQARCRKLAIESGDLSLLPTLSAKLRKKMIQKGISEVAREIRTAR